MPSPLAPVTVRQDLAAAWPPLPTGPHDTPFLQMGHGDLRFAVEGVGRFRITDGQRIAWQKEHPLVSDQDVRTYLLGSAVGALLIQRGMTVMHGNALERDGRAIVCLGPSGAGKSTLAYALMRQGWRLLADDLVAITPDGMVLPGIPRIKLWRDAAEAFELDPATMPPIRGGMEKYLLTGNTVYRAARAVPLQALYLLQGRIENALAPDRAGITQLASQKAAVLALCKQVYRPRFVRGLGREGANFLALARLQQLVPLTTLLLPAGIRSMQAWLDQRDLLSIPRC